MKYSIKELRARNNLTQEELAEKVGVIRLTIVKYENHLSMPLVNVAIKIAEVLGVTVEQIDW